MFKNLQKSLSLFITAIIILMLFSCSVNDTNNIFKNYDLYEEVAYETTSANTMNNAMSRSMKLAAVDSFAPEFTFETGNASVPTNTDSSRKIIKNYNISAETNNFETIYDNISKKIEEYKGIVDNSSVYNNNYRENKTGKHLEMTVRVEADNAPKFVEYITSILNVTSKSENIEDVTDNYNDINIRITTLETEILRLQELLKKAQKVTEIVEIEQKISSSTSELQKLKTRINNYDKRINYSTIYISVQEVVVLTEVKNQIPTNDKIKQAFDKNLADTKQFLINIGIYIFTHIPAIFMVLCFIFLICIFILIKNKIKQNKKNNKKVGENKDKLADKKDNVTEDKDESQDKQVVEIEVVKSENNVDLNKENNKTETDKTDESFDTAFEKLKNNISEDLNFRS